MSRIKNFFLPALVVLGLLTGFQSQSSFAGEKRLKVAMLIPGQIDDGGFMEAGYNGLLKIRDELGAKVKYIDKIQPVHEELTEALRKLANEKPDLLIAHGGQNSKAVQ